MESDEGISNEINSGFENKIKLKFRTNNFDDLKNFYRKNDKIRATDIQRIDEMVSEMEPTFIQSATPNEKNKFFNIFWQYRKLSDHETKIKLKCNYSYIKNIRKKTTIKLCYDFERFHSWIIHADGKKEKIYHTPIQVSPESEKEIPAEATIIECL